MDIRYDYYYSPEDANKFSDANAEEQDATKKIKKTLFKNKPYTEMVPFQELPKCGCANATFVGTGLESESSMKGVW